MFMIFWKLICKWNYSKFIWWFFLIRFFLKVVWVNIIVVSDDYWFCKVILLYIDIIINYVVMILRWLYVYVKC